MNLYWVSAIVQNDGDRKPWLLSMYDGQLSIEEAMKVVAKVKENYRTLSVWVDSFDESKTKHTVFHECYINVFGDVIQ